MSTQTIRAAAEQIRSMYRPSQQRLCEFELAAFLKALERWRDLNEKYLVSDHEQFVAVIDNFEFGLDSLRRGYPAAYGTPREERVIYYLDEVVPTLREVRELLFLIRDFSQ